VVCSRMHSLVFGFDMVDLDSQEVRGLLLSALI